ncbi:MAG TPA: FAD-binding protein [Acetobacteraceae bacterium]|nr:FAD-binding protein [Acetobacteraceae bacterium]
MTEMLCPADEAAVMAAVAAAAASGEALRIEGNGSKASMLRPVRAARTLSTRALTGITLHAPQELVFSARAGTPLAVIEAALAESGQHLIAEPPDLSALLDSAVEGGQTLGGVVATNLSGPRRIAGGAMRDHVLGVRAVNGAGELFRSGGRVLKNVTGLDLCKLLTGSHGTLGVLTEVTLKVLPVAEATGSVVVAVDGAEAGVAVLSAALGSPYGVSGACFLPAAMAARLPGLPARDLAIVRIEEFASGAAYRLERLRTELAAHGVPSLLDDAASGAVWRGVRDVVPLVPAAGEAVWRVSVRPSRGPGMLRAAALVGARGFLDWGGGLVWLTGPANAAAHAGIAHAAREAGGVWMLLRAPDALREAVDVVPAEPEPLARIRRRVKAALDPQGILNPGRLYAEERPGALPLDPTKGKPLESIT